jgi:hypothetical protein
VAGPVPRRLPGAARNYWDSKEDVEAMVRDARLRWKRVIDENKITVE